MTLAKLARAINTRGEQFVEMDSQITKIGEVLYGTLHRFTAIEAMNWYNTEKHRRATDAERKQIRVPRAFSANYREIPFAFDLASHTMVFTIKSTQSLVSPIQVGLFMELLLASPTISEKYGPVVVTVEQDEQALERILRAGSIKMLRITVNRPNESFRRFDTELFARLNRMRARSVVEEYQAEDTGGLEPDAELLGKATAATSNGNVDAKVIIDGVVEDLSTKDKPLVERVIFDRKTESEAVGFRRAVSRILDRIKDKQRDG
jgi:hypothetical protein